MKSAANTSRYLLALAESVLADLEDDHLALEPIAGAKTAGWLIGHLAMSGDFGRQLCSRSPLCPPAWAAAFAPGTTPSSHREDYPSMAALSAKFFDVYRDLPEAALTAPSDILGIPNPYTRARAAFPSAGDFVEYLLTAHLSYHLGQLTGWRAAAGLGRIKLPDHMAAS